MARRVALARSFYARSALDVAPELLNKLLVVGECVLRITETEAYLQADPASHSFRGQTTRNAVMFGPPGFLYVYFIYGMHWCANVVTGESGTGEAVLIRAGVPVAGAEIMRLRRPPGVKDRHLSDGPAKLAAALGFEGSANGTDLCRRGPIRLASDGTSPPRGVLATPRVGISKGVDSPWRFRSPPENRTARHRTPVN